MAAAREAWLPDDILFGLGHCIVESPVKAINLVVCPFEYLRWLMFLAYVLQEYVL